jgi:hypothetical protein
MSNDFINLIKGRAWSPVPDDILEDTRMSLKARAVMAWIVGRPSKWILYIRQMQHVLGMTETMWKSIRSELETAGYYRQERVRGTDGKIRWRKSITDVSAPSPQSPPMAKTIDGEPSSGFATGGEVGDIPPIKKQRKLPPPPTSSKKHTRSGSTPQQVVVDLDELVEAAYWQAMKADKVILNPSAWRASVRKRIQENGPSPEDQQCLDEWRAFNKAQERRQAEEAEKAAKAAQPVADREFARERANKLSRSFGRSASSRKNPGDGETTASQPQDDGGMPS